MEANSNPSENKTLQATRGIYQDPPEWLQRFVKQSISEPGLSSWIPTGEFDSSALVRIPRFPAEIGDDTPETLTIEGVRNEQQSGQIAVICTEDIEQLKCTVGDLMNDSDKISSENVSVRFVGYVPVKRSLGEIEWSATIESVVGDAISGDRDPDLIADPLLEQDSVYVPSLHAQPIWLTFQIPEGASPGTYKGTIQIHADEQKSIEYDLELTVREPVLPDPSNYDFYYNCWVNPSAIAEEYGVESWSDEHWEILRPFFDDLATRHQEAITTAIVERPWPRVTSEGVKSQTRVGYESMVKWYYDGHEWSFDFSVFDRYVETARSHGVGPRIDAFSPLSFRGPERLIYTDERDGQEIVEEVELGDDRWTEAWTAFFTEFSTHLQEKGWLEQTWLGIDEQPEENIAQMMALVKDISPSLADRIYVAGSMDTAEFAADLAVNTLYVPTLPQEYERTWIDETDISEDTRDVNQVSQEFIDSRRQAGKLTTYYVAGTPSHPNLFSFSPAAEARMLPWIAAENDLDGLHRWSYNNWPEDVFTEPVFHFIQGGEYIVYPGAEGPLSSIRWELLKEGIEDYELLQLATGDDPVMQSTESIRDAVHLATRNVDARDKEASDILAARSTIIDAVEDHTP